MVGPLTRINFNFGFRVRALHTMTSFDKYLLTLSTTGHRKCNQAKARQDGPLYDPKTEFPRYLSLPWASTNKEELD